MKSPVNTRIKVALVYICSIILILGGILLIRGYFTQNPINFDNNSKILGLEIQNPIKGSVLKPKTEKSISTVSFDVNTFKSYFDTYSTKNLWIIASDDNKKVVGFINPQYKFNQSFVLATNAQNVTLLNESVVMYVISEGSENKIVLSSKNEQIILDEQFDAYFKSIFFSELDKNFYYINQKNGFLYFYSKTLNSDPNLIFETDLLNPDSQIAFVDLEYIYIKTLEKCFKLNILSKKLIDQSCNLQKNNTEGLNFSIKEKLVENQRKYQILKTSLSDNIFDKVVFEDFTKIDYAKYTKEEIIFSLKGSNYTELKKVNINDSKVELILDELPKVKILDFTEFNENIFLITSDSDKVSLLTNTTIPSYTGIYWDNVFVGLEKPLEISFVEGRYF